MGIQSVIFDKDKYSIMEANEYLKHHHLKPIKKAHITEHYIRMRVDLPHYKHYMTKNIGDGIKAIIGF